MRNEKFRRHNDLQRCISERELETFGAQRKDHKFLGCSKDVMREVNEQCKLKSSCEMKVTDLARRKPFATWDSTNTSVSITPASKV